MPKLGSFAPLTVGCPNCERLGSVAFGDVLPDDADGVRTLFQTCLGRDIEISNHPSALRIRFVRMGSATIELNGRRFDLQPGTFVINNRGTNYSLASNGGHMVEDCSVGFSDTHLRHVASSLALSDGELLERKELTSSLEFPEIRFNRTSPVWPLLQQLTLPANEDRLAGALLEERLWDLCAAFLAEQRQIESACSKLQPTTHATRVELYRRLWTAREFIEASYMSDISLTGIARVACLSPYHFLRSYKAVTGMTPYRHVLQLRLRMARQLVTSTDLPFNLIAVDTGFSDLSNFSRSFKSGFGLTPTQARASANQ